MKLYLKLVALLGISLLLFGCPKDDEPSKIKLRPYAEVYAEDLADIETFLQKHYVTVDADYNTVFTEIPNGGTQTPVANMAELDSINVDVPNHGINYKVYFLKLRQGTEERPTQVDSVFISYKGFAFKDVVVNNVTTVEQTVFDQNATPTWFQLEDVIRGWTEVIPEFNTGTFTVNSNGSVNYADYGAGVMFIPSGLAYFNAAIPNVAGYSPLVFNFKLYSQRYRDHDRDGFLSKDEYGSFSDKPIDTDGDGTPDYLDVDDDNDGILTKKEREIPNTDPQEYYTFSTMPSCSGSGVKRHLDAGCKPPYN